MTELKADCEYQIKLKSRNKFGWSDEETIFSFKTSMNGNF